MTRVSQLDRPGVFARTSTALRTMMTTTTMTGMTWTATMTTKYIFSKVPSVLYFWNHKLKLIGIITMTRTTRMIRSRTTGSTRTTMVTKIFYSEVLSIIHFQNHKLDKQVPQ